MNITPIETQYRGYRFRSRLEARWAVYFDAVGIKWEYEPQGFDLGGEWYLPDFWLPQVQMWAEVKFAGGFSAQARALISRLVEGSQFPCLLLEGTPSAKPYTAIHPPCDTTPEYRCKGQDCKWCEIEYALSAYHDYPEEEGRFYCMPEEGFFDIAANGSDTRNGARAARSARFEHGESPTLDIDE